MVGQLLGFGFCVVGLISLIWTLWFWCVFGFEFGVLGLVGGVCLSVVVLRLRNWCGCWVVFGWLVLSVVVFLDWQLVGVCNLLDLWAVACLLIWCFVV